MSYQQKNNGEGYSDIWITPKWIYELLNKEFKFDLDAATEPYNPMGTPNFFTEQDNSLTKEWNGNVFLNPPYSNIDQWVSKAKLEWERERERGDHRGSRTIVLLIPARTDTKYFHELIAPFAEIRFIKGRLKFSQKGSAPFPSMVVIFGKAPNIKTIERNEHE